MNRVFVVDASATLKLFIEEPGSQEVHLFFSHLQDTDPISLHVPDLLYAECTNTLWKCVMHHKYPLRFAQAALADLAALALQATPTQSLFHDAFLLSVHHAISVYDACYCALAQNLRCPLITEDKDLIRKIRPQKTIALYSLTEALHYT